ncbi:nucleoside-diphosphate kinase [Aureisphaera sp. CAU 1614]|uniref:Nucleoside diphosphate kinase n=1 Tax=Halomarinibacterium sedimenti TaxID=2857106 RepID=A0A9X1FPU2_9FLAO|nr:nucleoside-diphosphate kinase [Halomarinibacterium sedimenti]MAL60286.1 nucleoside-diphosphate kinase [Flavobacteriaceae bacterium]MBW2938325.1 nucleoside-diphosphate kinase [Halomarinibacterium sedimenti]HAT65779.1 nucleoside-diphosphate kinase [Flavobacteriaceae bacterium]
MRTDRTFTMLKPDSVEKGNIGPILEKITSAGFRIAAMKLTQMTTADAQAFYAVHKERPFFGELVEYMTRGPIVAAVLEKDNAVEDFRTLIGATNPAEAAEGTIRKLYAASIGENAVHGSDSDENAEIESQFHFAGREIF